MDCYLGIDVGTGSARAGLFDQTGRLLSSSKQDIRTWRLAEDHVEQSSEDIWQAICACVRAVLDASNVDPVQVKGIGFDATCSLVALDNKGRPVSVSTTGRDEQNIIVWMDHRATKITDEINATGHEVLRYVGGRLSPEMETPKLVWLKRHLPDCWKRTVHFFDLPDFLTFRATGATTRSLCSTVCKWTYLGHESEGWDRSYFEAAGLEDLVAEGFIRIGTRVLPMGEPVGAGLTERAASELGLTMGTPVSVSIIDAHAGGIGMIGASLPDDGGGETDFDRRLALIGGTSSCHMAVSPEPRFIPGVWGPYFSAMVPAFWLTEGGQSATGALVDHVMLNHQAAVELRTLAEQAGLSTYEYLNRHLADLADDTDVPMLTRELHVCPYFHGNRSPRADAKLRGMVSGLHLSATLDDLALLYLATIQAIAYGTRHIIETLNEKGYRIDTIIACGGGTKNKLFIQSHADATGCRVVLPREPEAVLLGSAMLGATAAGRYATIPDAMRVMSGVGTIYEPNPAHRVYHQAKYKVFHRLHDDQLTYKELMCSQ